MGGTFSLSSISDKMFGRRQIARQQNSSVSSRTPLLHNNSLSPNRRSVETRQTQSRSRQTESKNRNFRPNVDIYNNKNNKLSLYSPARATGGPPTATAGPALSPQAGPQGQIIQQPQQQLTDSQIKLLECKIYEDFFKKTKNIKQIHQRHATTCANVLNKGLEATAKLPTGAPSIWDIKELAPNTSLTGIGIQQCMQVSDFLLYCKSKNVNYITDQEYSSIEQLESSKNQQNSQNPELRPMVIFCCSELLRTQQTLFISYFDIIKDYLKNGRKVIVLFWLNEQHFSKSVNADNFVVSLAHTKQQWKYFINRIKNLELDKNFMEDIGIEVGNDKIKELSEKLKLETTETLNYEEWEDIFYVSPIVYFNNPAQNRLLRDFSFDNRRFSSGGRKFLVGKKMYDPAELYKVLPRILAEYISRVGMIGKNKRVGFYEEELSQDVKMNLVFVSHHNSCENTLKYLTGGQSKENVFNKQQLMNAEIVILPKSGILWSREYSSVFTDDDFKVDNIKIVNMVKTELEKMKNMNNLDRTIKTAIDTFFNSRKANTSNSSTISTLQKKLSNLNRNNGPAANSSAAAASNSSAAAASNNSVAAAANSSAAAASNSSAAAASNNSVAAASNSSAAAASNSSAAAASNNSVAAAANSSVAAASNSSAAAAANSSVVAQEQTKNLEKINTLRHVILYIKYLTKQNQQNQQTPVFSLKNRIFPVGFYDIILQKKIKRKNKTNQIREIYPLFILYNSQLGIFFTPLDVIKQEVAIIPDVIMPSSPPAASQHVGGIFGFGKKERPQSVVNQGPQTGIQLSSQIFSLSSPFGNFLDMTLDEYINFLETSNKILIQINGMYNPQQSVPNVPAGVASAAVEHPEGNGNTYFYDYKKLSEIINGINGIISKIVQYNSLKKKIYNESKKKLKNNIQKSNLNIDLKSFHQNTIPIYKEQTLLNYLREKFDTKTLVHNLGRCLFDFCATTEPARNKLRQIVREKLKLEVVEKDYTDILVLEVQRQLQKFIDDHEKVSGVLQNNDINPVITISKGLFSTKKESKSQIFKDINILDKTKYTHNFEGIINFFQEASNVYKKYNIIDNSSYSKITSLLTEWKQKYNAIGNKSQSENVKKKTTT